MSDPHDPLAILALASQYGPALAYEDVPSQLTIWRDFYAAGDCIRTANPNPARTGMRWGLSATWDGKTPHLRLPEEALLRKQPAPGMYVTTSHYFDFVYDSLAFERTCRRSSHYNRAEREGVKCGEGFLAVDEALACIHSARTTRAPDNWIQDDFYIDRMIRVIGAQEQHREAQIYRATHEGRLVAWAATWESKPTLYIIWFFPMAEYRFVTRYLYAYIAEGAIKRGYQWINLGDAFNAPGLLSHKFDLKPAKLRPYFDVWSEPFSYR